MLIDLLLTSSFIFILYRLVNMHFFTTLNNEALITEATLGSVV